MAAGQEMEISEAQIATLKPGEAKLGQALGTLGAPLIVQEYQIHGMILGWAWSDNAGYGLTASYNFTDTTPSASFSWDDAWQEIPGVVLFFDRDLVLREIRSGRLGSIVPARQVPAPVEFLDGP